MVHLTELSFSSVLLSYIELLLMIGGGGSICRDLAWGPKDDRFKPARTSQVWVWTS